MNTQEFVNFPEVKIGTILCSRWGYSMTDYHFYEVVRRTEKTVWYRQLKTEATGNQEGYRSPIIGEYKGNQVYSARLKEGHDGKAFIKTSFEEFGRIWDGKPKWYNCD